uniref:Uncharacterized protein n=1 Tax=Rhizophagus irregularis (strain DAOM 181602 / DAOM 197198 / MUCL 43194) TaxID=747089 RepID=U9UHI3_RHIID
MFIPLMPQHNEKNLKEEQINISDIQEMIANRDNIADHIMRYGEAPWIELHLLMENNNHSGDEAESSKYWQQNIIDNLHIAIKHGQVCRFRYPKERNDHSFIHEDNHGQPELVTSRNNPYLNPHNK